MKFDFRHIKVQIPSYLRFAPINMYGAVDEWLHAFLTLAIRGEWSDPHPPPATSHLRGKSPVTLDKGVYGPRRPSGCCRKDRSVFHMLTLYPDFLVAQSIAKSKYSLKMEAVISSETLVTTRYSALRRKADEHSASDGTEREVEVSFVKYSAYQPTIAADRTLRPKEFMFYAVCCLLYVMPLCKPK